MRISRRLRQLERLDAIAHPPTVMERFQHTLDEASLRLTGKGVQQIRGDADVALVSAAVRESFIERLSDDDLASLVSGLEAITAGWVAAELPT